MSAKNTKNLRKEVTSAVQELLPQILNELVSTKLFSNLQEENKVRLDIIERAVTKALDEMSKRNKDAQDYIIRQVTAATTNKQVLEPLNKSE